MKLYQLRISRQLYGPHEGQYTGECSFDDDDSKVEIKITPECANQILKLCADGVVDAAQKVATKTRDNILTSVALLEHKVDAKVEVKD